MPPEVIKFLQDVWDACELLNQFTARKSFLEYLQDALLRAGVEREFILIGEALAQAQKLEPSLENTITQFRRIIGFRNILVHGYASINNATVWGVVEKDLPVLKQEVETLLAVPGS